MIQCDPKVLFCAKRIFLCTAKHYFVLVTKSGTPPSPNSVRATKTTSAAYPSSSQTFLLWNRARARKILIHHGSGRSLFVRPIRQGSVFSSSPKSANGGYDFDFDFARACPQATLLETQAMADQNISDCDKTLQNRPSAASTTPDPVQSYEM